MLALLALWISALLVHISALNYDPRECKVSLEGAEYMGTVSVTRTGAPCQRWDEQFPHEHNYTDVLYFADFSMDNVANHCRNPHADLRVGGPWCFTEDPDNRWEFCDIPTCHSFPECRLDEAGSGYRGSLDQAESGSECLDWEEVAPEWGIEGNFCRNPDDAPSGPWCYVSEGEREACDVPYCKPSASCVNTPEGKGYVGSRGHTWTGRVCQRWDQQTPHVHDTTADEIPDDTLTDAHNFCRNPDGDAGGPWCFTIDPDTPRESCDIPVCAACYESDTGQDYAGAVSETTSGRACQPWTSQAPSPHPFTDPARFPDSTLEAAANHCRNPDRRGGGPWCYVQDGEAGEWESCGIGKCQAPASLTSPAKHVIHIGVDGLHASCFLNASSGMPNIVGRLAGEGSYTYNARTTLQSVSAPGWTAHLCSLNTESSGIVGNGWEAPWMGYPQAISPQSGDSMPFPCVFQHLKAQDQHIRTAVFKHWMWIYWLSSRGYPGASDVDYNCGPSLAVSRLCDRNVVDSAMDYFKELVNSTERSYTFLHIDDVDGTGHREDWCTEAYLEAVDIVDGLVGSLLDAVEEAGAADTTVIMLSSDHGGEDFGHGKWQNSDIAIPFFIRGPGVRRNYQLQLPVHSTDIVPTATWALGLDANPWWEGRPVREAFEEGGSRR